MLSTVFHCTDKLIPVLWLAKCMGNTSPVPSRMVEIWQRFRKDPCQSLSKPYSMALLYMLHIEVFNNRFSTERPVMDEDRRNILRRFTTWCSCTSPPEGCNISWNFASQKWGLPRIDGAGPPKNCLIYNRYLEREHFKFAPSGTRVSTAYTKEENAIMNEAYDAFVKAWYRSGSRK